MEYTVNIKYGVAVVNEPIYWYENGKIHCDTGATIGWRDRNMTKQEALEMANNGGLKLSEKPISK
jgi:hypothetical protein